MITSNDVKILLIWKSIEDETIITKATNTHNNKDVYNNNNRER